MEKNKSFTGIGAPVRRNLNVERASCMVDDAVIELRDAIEALENHLAPLLACERPCAESECRERGESELAERILSNADAIRDKSARVRALIDRL